MRKGEGKKVQLLKDIGTFIFLVFGFLILMIGGLISNVIGSFVDRIFLGLDPNEFD